MYELIFLGGFLLDNTLALGRVANVGLSWRRTLPSTFPRATAQVMAQSKSQSRGVVMWYISSKLI
jgi:hypothetical protein